jgi:ABC-2 type transport system permease protein
MTTTSHVPQTSIPSRRFAARTVRTSTTLREVVSQTTVLAGRALIKLRRNPEQLLDVTVMPLIFTGLLGYVFGGAVAGGVASYLPILVPGIITMTTITACMAAGSQLRDDLDKGVSDRFRSLPISRFAPLAGPMLADLLRYLLAGSLTLAMGFLMGYRPHGGILGICLALLLAMLAGWSLAWIYAWIGTVAKSTQAVQGISVMVMFPLTFLSNAFVPVETLPGWLRAFVELNPVSHVVSALRDLLNHGDVTAQVGWSLLGCAVVAAIFLPLTVRAYSKVANG